MELSQFDNAPVRGRLVAVIACDSGLPCRLLGLFAARGVLPRLVELRAPAQAHTAALRIEAVMGEQDWSILCAKAAQPVGVL